MTINKKQKKNSINKPIISVTLLDKINQIAYVSDPITHEILFVNKYFKEILGENPVGKKCYEVFQHFQYPCEFCTNETLLTKKNESYEWEFYNKSLNKYFLISDQLIKWYDGRDARFELAIDITDQKQMEKKVQKTKSVFNDLANSITDIFFELDENLNVSFVNKAFNEFINKKDVKGKNFFDLFPHYKNSEKIKKIYHEVLCNKKTQHFSKNLIKNNQKYYFDISVYPSTKGITVLMKDNTENKKMEEKIQDISKFPSENPSPVFRVDTKGTILYANHSCLEILDKWGCSEGNEVPKYIKNKLNKSITTNKKIETIIKSNKKIFLFNIVPFLDGKYVNFYGIDITKLKKSEKIIKDGEERFRLAQRAAGIGTWDWNIKTDEIIWSEEIEPMFGFKKGEFDDTYEAFLNCIHPEDKALVEKAIKECIEGNKDYDIEHRIIWPDSTMHWVREIGDVIRNKKGKPIRMLGIVQDITDDKKIENAMMQLNNELLHLTTEYATINKELEAFSYSVSHDLRAPLRSIDGFSQALLEDYEKKLDNEGKDYLQRIVKSTYQMGNIIDNLLKLSRITQHTLSMELIDISKLSSDIINSLKKKEPKRKTEIKIEPDLTMTADKQLFEIALENLISNAWKFSSKKKVTKITIGSMEKKGKHVIFIKDNGAGFNMDYIKKLFIPFQRLHSSNEFKGSGIGLSIVSRIIHRHGGDIWADSRVDKGATFYFTVNGKIKENDKNE